METGELVSLLADGAAEEPLLLLAFLVAIGSMLGKVSIRGFTLGPAAVLFLALFLSALDPRLKLPADIGTLGLILFAYAIGITSGPSFAYSVRRGGPIIAVVTLGVATAASVTVLGGRIMGVEGPTLSGVFAGSLTNTPALAASTEAFASDLPTVGYSVTYLFGVLGMLVAATIALRTHTTEKSLVDAPEVEVGPVADQLTIRVETPDLPDLYTLSQRYGGDIVFSRIMVGDRPGHRGAVSLAIDTAVPQPGDILTAVGPSDHLQQLCADIGHPSTVALTFDRSTLDYRRALVSDVAVVGVPIGQLRLDRKFGATVTRVRRGDVDLVATDDFVLQLGDRVRIVAPRDTINDASAFFGDSEQRLSGFSMVGLGVGLLLGVFLGLLKVPLPSGQTLSLGLAGGVLLTGLFLGNLQKTGRIVWALPHSTARALTELGIVVFLAYAGSNSGAALKEALGTPIGGELFLLGLAITSTYALVLLLAGRYLAGFSGAKMAGVLAAAQTQPAVLAYANEKSGQSPDVNLGYALVYPAAMILKVVIAPFIGVI